MINTLISPIVAFILTFAITPLVIKIAHTFHLVDDPKKRRHPAQVHSKPVARAGGIALLVGILGASLFLPFNKPVIGLLIASILTVVIGVIDDYRDVSPYLRFAANIVIASIVVLSGVGIPFITNPLGGIIHLDTLRISGSFFGTHSLLLWADLFAVLWIVWTMNIIGWSSGIDGQMPGFVAITAVILGILSLKFSAHDISQSSVATLAFITAGAFLGFLPWNFYPQKIMPGYGGKTLAGLLLATIAILSGGKIGSALLILAIPMLDAVYALVRRILNKTSPFKADRYHLHHRLLDLGWSKRKIALFYWLVSAILGLIALELTSAQKFYVFVSIGVIVFGVLLWLSILIKHKNFDNEI